MCVCVCVCVGVGVRPLFAAAGASCLTHSSLLEVESSQALSGEWKDFVLCKNKYARVSLFLPSRFC